MSFEWDLFSQAGLRSIRESHARLNIWDGAVRSSKTVSSIVRWLEYVQEAPPGPLLMAGKTERTLKDNVLGPIEQMIDEEFYRYNRTAGEAHIAGRKIIVRGANDEGAESKIRGLTLSGAYGDELTLWPQSFFRQLLARLSVKGAKFFGTTNPDSPRHWLNRDFLEKPGLDLKRFRFRLEDNPNLDPAYVEALKKEYAGLWYERFVLGLWVVAEGAIYDSFDPEGPMVVDHLPARFERVHAGVDYGIANATVFLLVGLYEGRWYVFKEYFYDPRQAGRQKTDAEYSSDFRDFVGGYERLLRTVEVDPSAASFKLQLKRDGLRSLVRNADNDVLDGIRDVARALNGGTLYVHRSCENTIESLSSYAWDPRAQQRGRDLPLKENDHAADTLRYVCRRIFGRPALRVLKKPAGL